MHTHCRLLMLLGLAATSSAAFTKADCPAREAGQAYPWQNPEPMKGDHYAWVYIDVDKAGRALRCSIGQNDIDDPETRFRACLAYRDDWRAPPAGPADPAIRTIK